MFIVATQFFSAYKHSIDTDIFRRLLTQVINSSKSSNALVRSSSVQLFKTIIATIDISDPNGLFPIAGTELLNLPKTGKSAGPEHRIALYSMLSYITPNPKLSADVVQVAAPILAKEAQTQEQATTVLASVLAPHVTILLQPTVDAPLATDMIALIAKEMNSSKPSIKRAFCALTGSVLFEGDDILTAEKGISFAKRVLPALEACLKSSSSTALTASGGPIEGYIAISVLLGPFARSGEFGMLRIDETGYARRLIPHRRCYFKQCSHTIAHDELNKASVLAMGQGLSKGDGCGGRELVPKSLQCEPAMFPGRIGKERKFTVSVPEFVPGRLLNVGVGRSLGWRWFTWV